RWRTSRPTWKRSADEPPYWRSRLRGVGPADQASGEETTMAQFMLLLRGGATEFVDYSPEQIQQAIKNYEQWARMLIAQGKLRGGEKLRDDGGRLVQLRDGAAAVDGPFAETKETIGGYYLIEAADYCEATALAAGCPVLAVGGSVEVREIEPR